MSRFIIDSLLIDNLANEASKCDNLRKNICLHCDSNAPAQVMINDFEPGTNIYVHRHFYTAETLIILRGTINIHLFDDDVNLNEIVVLSERDNLGAVKGIVIPKDQWHWLEIVESSTVLEVKEGPYRPLLPNEIYRR